MAVCPEVKAIYEETIREFTFRDSDGITIPKNVRENAYTLAVDIVIVSTRREVYKNYGVTPAEGYYGSATLIMQDMCEIKIPVKMPRQRLYYGRVDEAFIHWQTLVDWSYFQTYMTAIGESLASLGTALGVSFIPPTDCCSLPDRSWIELPLREVYFNCPSGTQYKIEVSWYKALQIVDGCGNIRNPTSKTTDGDKDTGLPPAGVQPNVATNPSNPFANLPLPTSDSEQGGFANSKSPNLDGVDPLNLPTGNNLCNGRIETYTTAPENPVGVLANTFNFVNIVTPIGNSFIIESEPSSGGTLGTGIAYYVRLSPDGRYFNGAGFQTAKEIWSYRDTRVFAECRPE